MKVVFPLPEDTSEIEEWPLADFLTNAAGCVPAALHGSSNALSVLPVPCLLAAAQLNPRSLVTPRAAGCYY